ncbi:hypothetical protein CEXT_277391 [Caerostris extrusa]|uniref:Uncharacterized protein n=1 Tax=Caerostris extrusa TaxID=172846 RepID=A0AAV4NFY5_CAEEX|nr:hypothetical protein CEXT_277391 [Caerostris extrusa]
MDSPVARSAMQSYTDAPLLQGDAVVEGVEEELGAGPGEDAGGAVHAGGALVPTGVEGQGVHHARVDNFVDEQQPQVLQRLSCPQASHGDPQEQTQGVHLAGGQKVLVRCLQEKVKSSLMVLEVL